MFLKHLIIANNDCLIRRIDFRLGMNLIVDDTLENTEMTGNNVGKSTVLRLIDYGLGADAKPVYTASDGSTNQRVKDFLEETEAYVELCFVSTFVKDKGHQVIARRNFQKGTKALNEVNGKFYMNRDYCEALQMALWGVKTSTPTFSQIISHSIRIDHSRHEQPLQTLGKRNDVLYETLYLYLFGLYEEFCESKLSLRKKLSKDLSFIRRLEKESATLSTLRTKLRTVERAITTLNDKKQALVVNPDFEADLEKQVLIKRALTQLAMRQNNLELRRKLIEDAVREMKVISPKVQADEVKMLYQQANAFGAKLHHTFEELLRFHNDMLIEKNNFISSELPEIDRELDLCYKEMDEVRKEEEALDKKLRLSVSFETYEQINNDLFVQLQDKGNIEGSISQMEKVIGMIRSKEQDLKKIDDVLFTPDYTKRIEDRLDEFNDYFSAVSQKIYKKDFTIEQDKIVSNDGKPCYKFSIADNGNYSDGVKKGEATCFDLAYVSFADAKKIPCLHFILNDKEELLHNNQLSLIAQVVEEQKNVQYISSILCKKLPDGIDVNKYKVLSLKEDDKLFKIEG